MGESKLSPAAEVKVERIITIVETVLENFDSPDVETFFRGDNVAAEKVHAAWALGLDEVEGILSNLHHDWPSCTSFVSALRGYVKYYRGRLDFYPEWRTFAQTYDVNDPKIIEMQRNFVLKNRELDEKGRAEMKKAHEILMKQLGNIP